jgi:hypothetical protein
MLFLFDNEDAVHNCRQGEGCRQSVAYRAPEWKKSMKNEAVTVYRQ